MSAVLANPAETIGAPRVIHNDEELAAYTDALLQRTALANPSRAEMDAIELLTLLGENLEPLSRPDGLAAASWRFCVVSKTDYSYRSATMGSTLMARRAGM